MKRLRSIAAAVIIGAGMIVFNVMGGNWLPVTGTCDQYIVDCSKNEEGEVEGNIYHRTGTEQWCILGSGDCEPAACVYGPWTTVACE